MLPAFKNYCNILALLELPLAFIKGNRDILGETHEYGDVFFYISILINPVISKS